MAATAPAPGAVPSARPKETEEQRRARKKHEGERERRKAEEAKKAQAAKAGRTLTLPPVPTGEDNRLKRETAFLCKFRFKNDLPEITCDPKLLVTPFDGEKFAEFGVTALERNSKHIYLTEPDVGVPINLLDTGMYAVPSNPGPLAAEDEALLADDAHGDVGSLQRKMRIEHPWLVRTTYISNDLYTTVNKQQGMNEKMVKAIKEKAEQEATGEEAVDEDDRDYQISQIEKSFKAAAVPIEELRNPKDPSLRAVEVLPVLPDVGKWSYNYVHVLFDQDPTRDNVKMGAMSKEERKELARFAALKSYQIPGEKEGEPPDRFVAYWVPSEPPALALEGGGASTSAAGGGGGGGGGGEAAMMGRFDGEEGADYDWVREYHYETLRSMSESRHEMMCFHWGKDAVTYTDLNTKLLLHKKKARSGSSVAAQIIPERITLKRRAPTEDEEGKYAEKRRALTEMPEGLGEEAEEAAEASQ